MQNHQKQEEDLLCHLCGEYQPQLKFKNHVLRCYAKTIKTNQNYNPSIQTKDLLQLLSQKKLTLKSFVQDSVFECKRCEQLILKSKMNKHKKKCNKKKKKLKKPSIEDLFKEQIKKIFNSEQNIEEQQPKKKKIKTEKQMKKIKKTEGTKPTVEKNKRNNKIIKQFDKKRSNNVSHLIKTAKKCNQSTKRISNNIVGKKKSLKIQQRNIKDQQKKAKQKKKKISLKQKLSLKELMKKFTEIQKEDPLNFSKYSRPQSINSRTKSQMNSPQIRKIFTLKENQKSKENDIQNYEQQTPRKSKWMNRSKQKLQDKSKQKQMYSAVKSVVNDEASFFTIFHKTNQQQVENKSQRMNKWMRKKITLTNKNSFDGQRNQRNKSAPSDKFQRLRDRNKKKQRSKNEYEKMTSSQIDMIKQDIEDVSNYGPIDYYGQANYEIFQQILHPCQFCSRTFLPQRLQKHQKVCQFNNNPKSRFKQLSKLKFIKLYLVIKQQMNQINEPLYHPKDKKKLAELRQLINQIDIDTVDSSFQELLNDKKIIDIFQLPLNQIFVPNEANISEAFQKNNLNQLTHKNFQLTQPIIQFIAKTAQELKMSVLAVFTFFDEIVLENPLLQKGLQNFQLLQNKYNDIRQLIYQMHQESRKSYLLCLKEILYTYYYVRTQQIQDIFQQFLLKVNDQDLLLKAIISNLNQLIVDYKLNTIDMNYLDNLMEYKMEENKILEECLQLMIVNEKIQIRDENLFSILDIFKKRNFQSVLSQLMAKTNLYQINNNFKITQYNKQSILNQKMILLMIQLRGFDDNKQNDKEYQQKVVECNKKFGDSIDSNQAQDVQILVLPVLIQKFINQYYIIKNELYHQKGLPQSQYNPQFLEFIENKYNEIMDLCYEMEQAKSLFESVQRYTLKKLLELLWAIFKKDQYLFFDELQLEEPSILFLMLFKEMCKDVMLYQEFMQNDYLRDTNLGSFIDYYMASYPQENSEGFIYCQLIEILLQNHSVDQYSYIFDHISNLKFITIKNINQNLEKIQTKKKLFQDFDFEAFTLRKQYQIQGFIIDKDSTNYFTNLQTHIFEVNFNFFNHLIERLLYSVLRSDWDKYITIEQFQSLLQLFCKIVIALKEDKSQKHLQVDQRLIKIFTILTMILQEQRDFHLENSKDLFKIIKAIRILLFGIHSEIYKQYLLLTFSINQSTGRNIFVEIFKKTQQLIGTKDFQSSELSKYVYKIQYEIILVFQMFMADDNLIINQVNLNQTILGQTYTDDEGEQLYRINIDYFSKLYDRDVQIDDQIFYEDLMRNLQKLRSINYNMNLDLISQCFNHLLTPLIEIQEHQIQQLWQSQKNYILYQIKAETIELLNIFYRKFQYPQSKQILTFCQEDNSNQYFFKTLISYVEKIDVIDVIRNALEVRINKNQIKGLAFSKDILVQNKHILEVLKENQNISCKPFILKYINNVLELFALILEIAINFQKNKTKIEFSLVNELIDNFCFHEKFFSYKFGDVSEYYEVNMIVVLVSLLCEPEVQNQESIDDIQKIYYQNIRIFDIFKDQSNNINDFMTHVSFNSIISSYQYCKNWKKSNSIHNTVFKVLTNIINFWHTENDVSFQSLSEYISGQYNRLPFSLQFEKYFNLQIFYSLHQHHESVVDFLIACQKYQFEIIDSIFSQKNSIEPKSLTIIRLLRMNLQFSKHILGKENEDMNYQILFMLKIIQFIAKMFNEKRFSFNLQNQLFKGLFDLFQDSFFEAFLTGQEVTNKLFTIISKFYDYVKKQDPIIAYDNSNLFNFIFMDFLKQVQITISEIGLQFLKLFQKSFYLQLQSKYNYIFGTDNTYFYQNISNNLQKLLQFTSDDIAIIANYEYLKDIQQHITEVLTQMSLNNNDNDSFHQSSYNRFNSMNQQYTLSFQDSTSNNNQSVQILDDYNPNQIYLLLKSLKKNELQSREILMSTIIHNKLSEIGYNKKQLQKELIKIYNIIYQIGLTGNYQSNQFNTIPEHGSSIYALQVLNNLKMQNSSQQNGKPDKYSINEIDDFLKKNNFNLNDAIKIGHLKDKQIFQVHDFENYILYSQIKVKFDLNLIHIYYKKRFNNLQDIQIKTVKENLLKNLKDSNKLIFEILQHNDKTLLQNNTNLLKFQNFHLLALNYLHNNLFNIDLVQENQGLIEIVLHILQTILECKSDIKEIFDHKYNKSLYFFETMFYCLNYLNLVKYETESQIIEELYNFLHNFIAIFGKKNFNTKKMILLLNCLNLVTQIWPSQLQTRHLNQLSDILKNNELNYEVYNLIIDYFQSLLKSEEAQKNLIISDVYESLCQTNCIIRDKDYNSSEFYRGNRVKQIHSKFLKTLVFINDSCTIFQSQPNFFEIIFIFFQRYQQRILKIISFSENKIKENHKFTNDEMPESFRTQAALNELEQIMNLICYLSTNISQWKKQSNELVNEVGQILMIKTTRLFAKSYFYNNNNHHSLLTVNTISEKIIAKTTLEKQMDKISLQEMSNDNAVNTMNESQRRSTIQRQTISNNNMRTLVTSLFSLNTDCNISSIMFYLTFTLLNFLKEEELFSILAKNFYDETELQNFHIKFSQTIVDCQSFFYYMSMRLFRHSGPFLEKNLKLRYLYGTSEAYDQMCGTNLCQKLLSLVEFEELLRKGYEMIVFLYAIYIDSMKNYQNRLYEFNINHFNANTHQVKEDIKRYQQANQFNDSIQNGSSRRSVSNSRFRSMQRRSLTSPMAEHVQRDPNGEDSLQKKKDLLQHQHNMEFISSLLQ